MTAVPAPSRAGSSTRWVGPARCRCCDEPGGDRGLLDPQLGQPVAVVGGIGTGPAVALDGQHRAPRSDLPGPGGRRRGRRRRRGRPPDRPWPRPGRGRRRRSAPGRRRCGPARTRRPRPGRWSRPPGGVHRGRLAHVLPLTTTPRGHSAAGAGRGRSAHRPRSAGPRRHWRQCLELDAGRPDGIQGAGGRARRGWAMGQSVTGIRLVGAVAPEARLALRVGGQADPGAPDRAVHGRRAPARPPRSRSMPATRCSCSRTRSALSRAGPARTTCWKSQPPQPPGPRRGGRAGSTRSGRGAQDLDGVGPQERAWWSEVTRARTRSPGRAWRTKTTRPSACPGHAATAPGDGADLELEQRGVHLAWRPRSGSSRLILFGGAHVAGRWPSWPKMVRASK